MKHYLATFLILLGFYTKAQQQELLDNTWYLEKVVIEGEEYFTPNNEEVNKVLATFYNYDRDLFMTNVCGGIDANLIHESQNTFTLNSLSATLIHCGDTDNRYFEQLYLSIYTNNDVPKNPFQYEINNLENKLHLIVTNNVGNKAIYYSENLSIEEAFKNKITIAPNPVQYVLQFQNLPKEYKNLTIEIYDVQGKLIMNQSLKENNLNVSQLTKGIYFVKVKNGKEIIISQKIVKK